MSGVEKLAAAVDQLFEDGNLFDEVPDLEAYWAGVGFWFDANHPDPDAFRPCADGVCAVGLAGVLVHYDARRYVACPICCPQVLPGGYAL